MIDLFVQTFQNDDDETFETYPTTRGMKTFPERNTRTKTKTAPAPVAAVKSKEEPIEFLGKKWVKFDGSFSGYRR